MIDRITSNRFHRAYKQNPKAVEKGLNDEHPAMAKRVNDLFYSGKFM
jgi:hypothetical protein